MLFSLAGIFKSMVEGIFSDVWKVSSVTPIFKSGNPTNYIMDVFSKRCQVDVIYTDFTKAFDQVNYNLLLKVLSSSGSEKPLLSWFTSYFFNRKLCVKLNGGCSSLVDITSGVLQNGYLLPLLFAFYVDNIIKVLRNYRFLLFANDIKLFLLIDSVQDCIRLQEDLEYMVG